MPPPFDLGSQPAPDVCGGGAADSWGGMPPRCQACGVRSHCLPGEVAERETLDQVERRLVATRRKVRAGDALLRADDRFRSLYAVRTGFFKTTVSTRQGREQITGFTMCGELLGLDGIGTGRHQVNAIALEDSQVCVIPYDGLQALAREVPHLQERFHRLMSREIVQDHATMVQLGSMLATQRIADFLLNLADRLHRRGFSASALVLRMRRSELASYLGLEIETVCRVFSKLHATGLLRVAQRDIRIIDRDALIRLRDGPA